MDVYSEACNTTEAKVLTITLELQTLLVGNKMLASWCPCNNNDLKTCTNKFFFLNKANKK